MTQLHIMVTGASSGFGQLITEELLKKGHKVLAVMRGGQARQIEIFAAHPDLYFIQLDLTENESFQTALIPIEKFFESRLDILINAAGYGLLGPIELQSYDQIHTQMQVNFFAPLQLIQQCLPYLKSTKGRILNITSMAAFTVYPFYGTYAATKHALQAATEALYYELRPFGVQVSSIEPGGFKTNFRKNIKYPETNGISEYEHRMKRFEYFINSTVPKIEKNPASVVKLVISLCEKPKIRPRYTVGADAWWNMAMRRLIPDRYFIPIQSWVYQKFFF